MNADARRLHLWSGLVVLGVFLAGAMAGAGVMKLVAAPAAAIADGQPARGPMVILRQLDLSPDQRAAAMRIMAENRATVEAAVRETSPVIRAAREKTLSELRAILTPEQAARFDALRAEQLRRLP